MKIGIDIRALNTSSYGGVSEYIRNLLPALFLEGGNRHSFHLFTNSRKNPQDYSDFLSFNNVTLHEFRYPNKFFTFSCRYLNRPYLDKLVGGVDVFFSPHFLPAPVSPGTKRVTTFHDLSFEYFPEYFDRRRRLWHKYMSPATQAKMSDKLIAVSHSTKNDIVNIYGIPKEKINVVYLGICDSITNPPASNWNSVKRKYKIQEDYILSLSTIEPRKNIVALIRAFNDIHEDKKFKNLHLVIAGAKGWEYKNILKEASNSPHVNKIIFTGPVKEDEKSILYKKAKVFIYPSLYEGFGFPPLEAMYSGTPTIASFVTSLPEVTGGAAILINPYIPKDISRALKEILLDKGFAEYLSIEGKKRAERFSWEKTAKETLRVLIEE
ncbi:MAG: glycosyltransferase family 1 protein [Candidatus Spechtbacterales bacterium]